MATRKQQDSSFRPTLSERAGATVGEAQDLHIGVVRGYTAARDPEIVEHRASVNAKRIDQLKAALLAQQ